jgi:hypothetical protein
LQPRQAVLVKKGWERYVQAETTDAKDVIVPVDCDDEELENIDIDLVQKGKSSVISILHVF